jgi:hypothetical protein
MKANRTPETSYEVAKLFKEFLQEQQGRINSVCEEHIRYLLAMYSEYLSNDEMPVLTANWLNDWVWESHLALHIVEKAVIRNPEWGLAYLVRAKVNLRIGDLTNILDDLEIAEKHGADSRVVKNVRARYFIETKENPNVEFHKVDDSLNIFIEEKLASSWAARRKLHEKLRELGDIRNKNIENRLSVEESSVLRQLKNWPPISDSPILKRPPRYLLAEQLNALLYFEEHAAQFSLILTEQDLLFYRDVFFGISKLDFRNSKFDINPFVWLSNCSTDRVKFKTKTEPDWEMHAIEDDFDDEDDTEDKEPNDLQWNEESEEWTWWDQV